MSPEQFLNSILQAFYARMHTTVTDNYDSQRFSYDGVDRSNVFNRQLHASYMAFFTQHYREFHTTWLLLADAESRELFARLVLYRLLGHHHMKVRETEGFSAHAKLYADVEALARGDSALAVEGDFGGLRHFEGLQFEGRALSIDCWPGGIVYAFLRDQYFFERGDVRIQPEVGETVLDLGACLGETSVAFAARVGPTGRVYGFDPLPDHVKASRYNLEQNGLADRATIVPRAVSKVSNDIGDSTASGANPGFHIFGKGDTIPIVSVDDFVRRENLTAVDFIKMDIEGSELGALEGAKETIARFGPKLAISLYHRNEDFTAIPRFISSQGPAYEFYLDHYTVHSEETVLYARVRR